MRSPKPRKYTVYCDGASRKDGRGGWGCSIRFNGRQRDICGGDFDTTNNRMELTAAIEALLVIDDAHMGRRQQVEVISDSQYLVKGVTEQSEDWIFRGWRTSANKPIKNRDLWIKLLSIVARHDIEWTWVKGHTGNPGNERADKLAGMGVPELR